MQHATVFVLQLLSCSCDHSAAVPQCHTVLPCYGVTTLLLYCAAALNLRRALLLCYMSLSCCCVLMLSGGAVLECHHTPAVLWDCCTPADSTLLRRCWC